MALKKQLVPLPIDKGLETKFDPKQEEPGYLRKAENLVYETLLMLRKRNGYDLVDLYNTSDSQVINPIALSKYKEELILFTNSRLYSYAETRGRLVDKGPIYSTSSNLAAVVKTSGSQSQPDSAYVEGYNVYVWKDATSGVRYSVQDASNNSFLISNGLVEAGAERPVISHINGDVYIIYGNGANLRYRKFSVLEPETLATAVLIASNRHTTSGLIDAETIGTKIAVAYNASAAGNDLQLLTISANGTVSSIIGISSASASIALDVLVDSSSRIVVTYSDGSYVKYLIYPATVSAAILGPTLIETVANVTTCCTVEISAGVYKAYYEVAQGNTLGSYIKQASTTVGGSVTGISVFKRSVGLGARAFRFNGSTYIIGVLDSEIQSSYFIFDSSGMIVTKLANQVAGGIITYGVLQPVSFLNNTQVLVSLIVHNKLQSDNGVFFSTDGISAATINFEPDFKYSDATIADGLHICAGILKFYDGATVTEHGFHVFPETLTRVEPSIVTITQTTNGVVGIKDVQKISYSAVPTSGAFTININGEVTASTAFNASNATIKANIEALASITTVTVTGDYTAGHTITFDTPIANIVLMTNPANTLLATATPVVITNTTVTEGVAEVKEVQTVTFSEVPVYGTFKLNIDTEITAAINYTQGAADVKAAIEALASITTVTVTGSFTTGFVITFDSPVAINSITLAQNTLSTSSATGSMIDGSYGYVAVYRWTDNNGRDHRSAPTLIPYSVVLNGGTTTQQVKIKVQTLRVTEKESVAIEIYRTEANGVTYYKVTDDNSPLYNDTTVDSVTFADTMSDTTLISKELLYTTGGVLENIAAPASSQVVSYLGNRLAVIGEDGRRVYFSKETEEGKPLEFTDGIYRDIDQSAGALTTIKTMNDKMILFSNDACYYISGEGPNNLGQQDGITRPEIISTDIGCISPDSVALTPTGLMFKSRKGIWQIDGGLGMQYIGARVEQYNSDIVTSAAIVGELNQVRFTLSNERTLVYNYNIDRWSTFENHGALDSVVINNDYYYLREDGALFKENRSTFSDAGSPIKFRIETGWLSLAQLQGMQRIYHALILGSFKSAHKLKVQVAYDFKDAYTQEVLINVSDFVNTATYGDDPTYGDSSPYGGNGSLYQVRVDLAQQKCQSIKLLIEDVQGTAGEGFTLSGVTLRAGVKEGTSKLPSTNKVGTS